MLLLAILAAMVAPLLTLGVKALGWGLFVEEPEVAETSESPALALSSTTGLLPDGALGAVPVLPPLNEPVTAVESSTNWTALSVTVGLWAWVALSLLAVVRVARSVVLGRRIQQNRSPSVLRRLYAHNLCAVRQLLPLDNAAIAHENRPNNLRIGAYDA